MEDTYKQFDSKVIRENARKFSERKFEADFKNFMKNHVY